MRDIKIPFDSIDQYVSINNVAADYFIVGPDSLNPDEMLICDNKGKVFYRYFVSLESWVSFPTPMPVSNPSDYLPLKALNLTLIQILHPLKAK